MIKLKEIEQIEEQDKLNNIISELLKKMGLDEVNRLSPYEISAKSISQLEERVLYFICVTSELNGKNETISEILNNLPKNIDSIYIVTSKSKISNYFKNWIDKLGDIDNVRYWTASEIINNIDKYYIEYWDYDDSFLKSYEDYFELRIKDDIELRSLLKLEDKYIKLLDIFIDPKLSTYVEDKETNGLVKKKFEKNRLSRSGSYIISGDAGTGKSTLLKETGKHILSNNKLGNKKSIPILLKVGDIILAGYDIKKSIDNILLKVYKPFEIDNIFKNYSIVLLVDSIDDLVKEKQIDITKQIESLISTYSFRYIICTRSYEYFIKNCHLTTP